MSQDTLNVSDDFLKILSDDKQTSLDHLHSLGINDDLSNAVSVGAPGSMSFENERDCPDCLQQFSEGWWFARYAGSAEYFIVNLVPAFGELRVMFAGKEGLTLKGEVAGGLRIVGKIEFPSWMS